MDIVAAEASGDEKAFRLQTEVQDAKLERKIRVAVWNVLSGSKNDPKDPLLPLLPKEILIPGSLLEKVRPAIEDVLKGTGHGGDYVILKVPLEEDPHLNVYKKEEERVDPWTDLGYQRTGSSRRTRASSHSRRPSATSSHRSKRKANGRRNRSDDPPF